MCGGRGGGGGGGCCYQLVAVDMPLNFSVTFVN